MSKAIIKRRSLLQQLGAAAFLATPVFRSVLAEAQGQAPLRLIIFHIPSGVSMIDRTADESVDGSMLHFDHYLSPMKELASDILMFNDVTMPTGAYVSTLHELEGHGGGLRTMLTSNTNQAERSYGDATSIDQLLANAFGTRTRFGSLQLGVITNTNGTAWGRRIVYNNGTFFEPVEDARAVFARLFPNAEAPAQAEPTITPDSTATAELMAIRLSGKSRLDQLTREVQAIKGIVGAEEKARLDLHLTGLRELENALPVVDAGAGGPVFQGVSCMAPNIGNPPEAKKSLPEGSSVDYMQELGPVMQELLYQSINCDLTRIATFQWMASGDNNFFPFLGIRTSHHGLEHGWHESAANKEQYDKIQSYLFSQMSVVLKRLKATPEGDGSMLDNSLVLFASEMWGGHSHHEYITFTAGKAGGKVRPGRTIKANGAPHGNLLLSIANTFGLNMSSLGDPKYCTGPLSLA